MSSIPARPGGWGGWRWPVAARLQAPLSFPPSHVKEPGDDGCHIRGGWDVRVFTLTVLPAHPAQMPVLANNKDVQGGEDRPLQNGPQVLLISKGQVGQVRVIVHIHSCEASRGRHLEQGFLIPSAIAAAAAAALGGTPAFWPPSCDEVSQWGWEDWSNVAPPPPDRPGLVQGRRGRWSPVPPPPLKPTPPRIYSGTGSTAATHQIEV